MDRPPLKDLVRQAIRDWRLRPFARGTADCCAFADHVVSSITGETYIPEYFTDAEAQALIDEHGGLVGAVTHWFERMPEDDRAALEVGDVVYIVVGGHEAIGVLASDQRVATVLEDGSLRMVSDAFIECGWKLWA